MRHGKVFVKRVAGKRYLQLAWIDQSTGRERRRSAGTGRMRDAAIAAAELERTLDRGVTADGTSWKYFCERYEAEHVSTLKARSQSDWPTVQRAITLHLDPANLRDLNAEAISRFKTLLRSEGKSVDTVARYLRILRSALKWAESIRLIDEAPFISMPRNTRSGKSMKGRPITQAEFKKMLVKVRTGLASLRKGKQRSEVTNEQVDSWMRVLWIFWLSGIRLSELPELSWDEPDKLCIQDIDSDHPMLLIHQELEKGNRNRHYPLTWDFVEYLRNTPTSERTGPIASPLTYNDTTASVNTICKTITAIGLAAEVVVSVDPKSHKKKHASAHDLRRSFGTRWAPLVQPPVLQKLMRHKNLSTTMAFYVQLDAKDISAVVKAAHLSKAGDLLGDPKAKNKKSGESQNSVS